MLQHSAGLKEAGISVNASMDAVADNAASSLAQFGRQLHTDAVLSGNVTLVDGGKAISVEAFLVSSRTGRTLWRKKLPLRTNDFKTLDEVNGYRDLAVLDLMEDLQTYLTGRRPLPGSLQPPSEAIKGE
jgi:hypothetical protein